MQPAKLLIHNQNKYDLNYKGKIIKTQSHENYKLSRVAIITAFGWHSISAATLKDCAVK
jgi:hypothetical protein